MERHEIAWWTAGAFAVLALFLTIIQVRLHLQWNNTPLRKYIIRILMMAPIYALESWLGLRFKDSAIYFNLLRECYEAFVIYSFYQFLLTFLGGEIGLHAVLQGKPPLKHVFPFCYLRPWRLSAGRYTAAAAAGGAGGSGATAAIGGFALNTQIGTLQYCILKPITATLAFIMKGLDIYGDGQFRYDVGYPYLAFIENCSQMWAIYCLVLFYHGLKNELQPIKPVPKFLVVKAVVFFTFWQGVLLVLLQRAGVIHNMGDYSGDKIVSGLEDFLVCFEMAIASIAHHYVFHHKEFHDPTQPLIVAPMFRTIMDVVNVSDVYVHDVAKIAAIRKENRRQRQAQQGSNANRVTSSILLPDEARAMVEEGRATQYGASLGGDESEVETTREVASPKPLGEAAKKKQKKKTKRGGNAYQSIGD